MSILFTKVTIGACQSSTTYLKLTYYSFLTTYSVTSCLGPLGPITFHTYSRGFGAVRGVCVTSHLWVCVSPVHRVKLLPGPVLYRGVWCVPSVGVCVSPVHCVSLCLVSSAVRCVLRPICGRVCVPRPLHNWVFSAVRGVCVTSHLWAFVCPPSTV